MRKISKTRTDDADDVVSSTNGSVVNDDQDMNNKHDDDNDEDEQNVSEKHSDAEEEDEPLSSAKKAKGKRGRKKKADKKGKSDEDEDYEVEKIMDSKKIKGKLHYLIRWKGYSVDEDTWEPENTLSCPELISKFNEEKENSKNQESSGGSKRGRKRKSDKKSKSKSSPSKKPKNEWDSEQADKNAEYEVEKILEVHHKKNGKREFLIHWKGWSSKFDSWEPENNLNCPDLIKKFMDKVEAARSVEGPSLRVARETTNRFTLQAPSSGRRLSKRAANKQRVRYDDAE